MTIGVEQGKPSEGEAYFWQAKTHPSKPYGVLDGLIMLKRCGWFVRRALRLRSMGAFCRQEYGHKCRL